MVQGNNFLEINKMKQKTLLLFLFSTLNNSFMFNDVENLTLQEKKKKRKTKINFLHRNIEKRSVHVKNTFLFNCV